MRGCGFDRLSHGLCSRHETRHMPRLRLAPFRAHARFQVAVSELGVVRRLHPSPVNEKLEFHSPLPPNLCAKLISEAIDPDSLFSLSVSFRTNFFVGRVTESSLRLRRRIEHRNSFQRRLVATLRPEGTGTVISGRFVMHPLVFLFTTVWFTGVILFGAALVVISVYAYCFDAVPPFLHGGVVHKENISRAFFMLPIMILFAITLLRFEVHDDVQAINDFLTITLSQR